MAKKPHSPGRPVTSQSVTPHPKDMLPLPKFRAIGTELVDHTQFVSIFDELCNTINLLGRGVVPLGCLAVLGPPDVGKSTLVRMLELQFPRVRNGRQTVAADGTVTEADHVPVVAFKMPTGKRLTDVLREMLKKIGDPHWSKGREHELKHRANLLFRACGVRAIVIDDAQRAVDRLGAITQEDFIEYLKDLYDDLQIAIVLVGLSRAKLLFRADEQFGRRFLAELEFRAYDWKLSSAEGKIIPQSRENFISLLCSLLSRCPIPLDAGLKRMPDGEEDEYASDFTCLRFYCASRGLTGRLKRYLTAATKYAEQNSIPVIDEKVLAAVFDLTFHKEAETGGLSNPFSPDWIEALPPPLPDDMRVHARRKRRKAGRLTSREKRLSAEIALGGA